MPVDRVTELVQEGLRRKLCGDPGGAAEAWEQALQLDPSNARARNYLDSLRASGAIAAAVPAAPKNNPFARPKSAFAESELVPSPFGPSPHASPFATAKPDPAPESAAPAGPPPPAPHDASAVPWFESDLPGPDADAREPASQTLVFGSAATPPTPKNSPWVRHDPPDAAPPAAPSTMVFGAMPPLEQLMAAGITSTSARSSPDPTRPGMPLASVRAPEVPSPLPSAPQEAEPGAGGPKWDLPPFGEPTPPPAPPPRPAKSTLVFGAGMAPPATLPAIVPPSPFRPTPAGGLGEAPSRAASDGSAGFVDLFDEPASQDEGASPPEPPAESLPEPTLDAEALLAPEPLIGAACVPDAEPAPAPDDSEDIGALLIRATDLLDLDDHSGALEAAEKVIAVDPANATAQELVSRCQATLQVMFESKLGDLSAVPRVLMRPDEIVWLNLDHRAGFLLSMIDGAVNYDDLFALSSMSRLETARILTKLLQDKVIG